MNIEQIKQTICNRMGVDYPSMKKTYPNFEIEYDPESGEQIGTRDFVVDASSVVESVIEFVPYIQQNAIVPPGIPVQAGGNAGATTGPGSVQ